MKFIPVMLALAVAGAAAAPQTPPRTQGQRSAGARITGIVVNAEDARTPIRRAMVALDGPSQVSQITDDDGKFVFEDVAAGEYQVTATRAAYLPAAYGARRPGRLTSRLSVASGATIDDVTLYMARGAAIEGTVRDINGEPATNVPVTVVPAGEIPQLSITFNAAWVTDDRGVYRIYGLAPGSYVVFASPVAVRRGEIVQQSGQTVSYGPVFHPSSSTFAGATVLTLAAGDDRPGVDINLILQPTRAIEGIVLDLAGQPATNILLFISGNGTPNPVTFDAAPVMTGRSTTLGAGRFRYTNVTAGRYTITAKRQGDQALWARAEVDVSGADVSGLELRLQPAPSIAGRIAFDGKSAPPNPTSVRLSLSPPTGSGGGMGNQTNYGLGSSYSVNADEDGNFLVTALIPGEYVAGSFITGNNPATGWWLRSAMVNGVDAVDLPAPIDGTSTGNIVFTFSDRHGELSGALLTQDGQAATEHYVVVIPADRALWRPNSRRMKFTRPSTAGRYVFADLPPGDYLLAAVTDFAASDFKDRALLEQLAAAGVKISLTDGAKVVQDLKITPRTS